MSNSNTIRGRSGRPLPPVPGRQGLTRQFILNLEQRIQNLPTELQFDILNLLEDDELSQICQTSRFFRDLCSNRLFWKIRHEESFGKLDQDFEDIDYFVLYQTDMILTRLQTRIYNIIDQVVNISDEDKQSITAEILHEFTSHYNDFIGSESNMETFSQYLTDYHVYNILQKYIIEEDTSFIKDVKPILNWLPQKRGRPPKDMRLWVVKELYPYLMAKIEAELKKTFDTLVQIDHLPPYPDVLPPFTTEFPNVPLPPRL